jgi:putative DNA primase/helicase
MTAIMSVLPRQPNLAAIETYVDVVFSYLEGTVAVRIYAESTDPRAGDKRFTRVPFLTTGPDLAKEILKHAEEASRDRLACYVIPATTRGHGHAKAGDILATQTVVADVDSGDIEAKRAHLIKWLGPPTLETWSGGVTEGGQRKWHAYWKLRRAAGGKDLAEAVRLRHVIALKIGDDPSFQRVTQCIRIAGTVHFKNGEKLSSGIISRGHVTEKSR